MLERGSLLGLYKVSNNQWSLHYWLGATEHAQYAVLQMQSCDVLCCLESIPPCPAPGRRHAGTLWASFLSYYFLLWVSVCICVPSPCCYCTPWPALERQPDRNILCLSEEMSVSCVLPLMKVCHGVGRQCLMWAGVNWGGDLGANTNNHTHSHWLIILSQMFCFGMHRELGTVGLYVRGHNGRAAKRVN